MTGALLESFTAFGDATRCRILLILEAQELTVSEICAVLQLPQSTVSRHLKTLADADRLTSRRDGTSRYYSMAVDPHAEEPRAQSQIWRLIRPELAAGPSPVEDARRLERVLHRRSEKSQQFFATTANEWDRLRDDLFGEDFYFRALIGLLPSSWIIGDLGCGTGAVIRAIAPHVARVIGVDGSEEMLDAARARLTTTTNVELRRGPLEALPLDDGTLDAATLMLVLHHLPSPAAALAEAHRVLAMNGRLLIVDMAPHDREEYRQQMGHVWLGFSEEQMRRLLAQAGFDRVTYHQLPPATGARGPALFAMSASRAEG